MHAISSHLPKKTIPSMRMRRRTKKRYISTLLSPHNLLPRFYAASKRTHTKRSYQSWPQKEEGNGTTEKRQIHVSQDISLKAGSTDQRKKKQSHRFHSQCNPFGPLAQVKAQNSETERSALEAFASLAEPRAQLQAQAETSKPDDRSQCSLKCLEKSG